MCERNGALLHDLVVVQQQDLKLAAAAGEVLRKCLGAAALDAAAGE